MGWRTIGPPSSGLGEGLTGRDVLIPLRTSDSWLRGHCVKKQCGLVGYCFGGRTALDLRLSRVCTRVAEMRKYCNYQLDTTKSGRKGVKSK